MAVPDEDHAQHDRQMRKDRHGAGRSFVEVEFGLLELRAGLVLLQFVGPGE